MRDILERLYDFDNDGITASDRYHLRFDAGKEIERLREEIATHAKVCLGEARAPREQ